MKEPDKMAEELEDFVNNMSMDEKAFADCVMNFHRSLQQSTMRLFLSVIQRFSEQKNYDLRNEKTVMLSKKIMEAVGDDKYLPFV